MAVPTSQPEAADGLRKVEAATAAQVLDAYEASEDASALATDDLAPRPFLDLLLEKELVEDAVTFLAYALPRREALLWGLGCVRAVAPEDPAEALVAAVGAADAWIAEPTDEHRRAAMVAAEAATFGTPAGCLALAVFFSEGSMSPPDCPAVPVGEGFCARTVAAAIHLSGLANGPEEAPAAARGFVEEGIRIANEPAPWETSP